MISYASRERFRTVIKADHSDIDRIVGIYERDLKTLGALRATNKGQPFRTYLVGNRMQYYELAQDLWRMRQLAHFRGTLKREMFLSKAQLTFAYNQMWHTLHGQTKAVRAVAGEDPEALMRALKPLKETARRNTLHQFNPPPRDL
jgi:hypothetical protein